MKHLCDSRCDFSSLCPRSSEYLSEKAHLPQGHESGTKIAQPCPLVPAFHCTPAVVSMSSVLLCYVYAHIFEHLVPAGGTVWESQRTFRRCTLPCQKHATLKVAFEVIESGLTSCSSPLFPVCGRNVMHLSTCRLPGWTSILAAWPSLTLWILSLWDYRSK